MKPLPEDNEQSDQSLLSDNPEPLPSKNVLVLPPAVERELSETDESLGGLGRPFNHRSPFFIGLTGTFGVAIAYVIARGIADVASVLVIIGLALFIAIGLNPIIEFLINRGRSRDLSVIVVVCAFLALTAGFVVAAVPPISHEVQTLI